VPTFNGMKTCPRCAGQVPDESTRCGACGALAIAPPVAVQTFDNTPATAVEAPGATRTAAAPIDDFYVSAPIIRAAPRPPRSYKGIIIGAAVVVGCAVAALTVFHHAQATKPPPSLLPAKAPIQGIPASLGDVTRMQAESTRHYAIQMVEQDGGQFTLNDLAQQQPGYQWVTGDQPSTTNIMVSVDNTGGVVTVAVSTPSKLVCAFGRWSAQQGATYVTMKNEPQCAAVDAPSDGWTTQPGGSASDLPDENG
jgi:hypothetical protein